MYIFFLNCFASLSLLLIWLNEEKSSLTHTHTQIFSSVYVNRTDKRRKGGKGEMGSTFPQNEKCMNLVQIKIVTNDLRADLYLPGTFLVKVSLRRARL